MTDLNAAITGGVKAGHVDVVTLTGGTDAGTYLASRVGGVAGALTAADTAIHLAGAVPTLTTSNFA